MDNHPRQEFDNLLAQHTARLGQISKQIRTTSLLRLTVFFLTVVAIYFATTVNMFVVFLVALTGGTAFVYLIRKHQKQELERARCQAYVKINAREADLLEKHTNGLATGSEYVADSHPYAGDLDLFGSRSLFQLINRTATHAGRNSTAQRLLTPILNRQELIERQEAIVELSNDLTWRQQFEVAGLVAQFLPAEKPEEPNDLPDLLSWVSETTTKYDNWYHRLLVVLVPVLGVGVVLSIFMHWVPPVVFLVFLLLPAIVLAPRLGELGRLHSRLTKQTHQLNKYARLFKLIEKQKFKSILNLKLQREIKDKGAGSEIHHLSRIMAAFDYRLNMIMGVVLNVFLLWDILQAIRMERWKLKNKEKMRHWFHALASMDELISLAGFAYGNPESVFPTVVSGEFKLLAKNLKHPLLLPDKCVGNPVEFTKWQQFQVITGANMAGKSTYLRTVGVNMVLAMAGAPVLASSFSFVPVQIFTGIKTSDSIQDGESYFFAELKRLKELIDRLKNGQPLFIILDEILRGTNSADKQKGSKALITQLIAHQSSGMIATHDLTLGELAVRFQEHVANHRFEVEIRNNRLEFDYLLKEGISENLNATFLMKQMGITL